MGKRAIRLVDNWGDTVYCVCCKQYRNKNDFHVRRSKDKYYYDSYCKKCRSTIKLKPQAENRIFKDEIPMDVKARWDYAKKNGLLIYPCWYTFRNILPKVEVTEDQYHQSSDIYKDDIYTITKGETL